MYKSALNCKNDKIYSKTKLLWGNEALLSNNCSKSTEDINLGVRGVKNFEKTKFLKCAI
jgi:hypothetical protein